MIGEYSVGPGLLIPARSALLLLRVLRIEDVRLEIRDQDREVASVLASWLEVAANEQRRLLDGSVCGTSLGDLVPESASSSIMGTREVANAADVSERAVRKAAASGALAGMRFGHAWQFAPADVALWLSGRG